MDVTFPLSTIPDFYPNPNPCLKCAVRTQDTTVSQALEQRSRSTKARAGDGDGPAYDQTTEGLSIWGLLEIRLHGRYRIVPTFSLDCATESTRAVTSGPGCQYQGCDQQCQYQGCDQQCQYQGCDHRSVSTRAVTTGVSVPGL
ncbi:unnamed protein product [Arctogadus glacialis]